MRLRTLAWVAVLAGCHGPLAVSVGLHPSESSPAWVNDDHLSERTSTAASTMARVWGGTPSDLAGWTIKYSDRYIEERARARVVGKSTRTPVLGGGTIEIWAGTSNVCLEATDLAHEIGHVVIRDHDHRDPRWLDPPFWKRMAEALCAVMPPDDLACRERLESANGIWH